MSTQRKELVAIAHAVTGMNEVALKYLTVMFNRISIQGLFVDFSRTSLISPDFAKVRASLAELGVLFDLDPAKLKSLTVHDYDKTRELIIEDANLYTQPTFGMSAEEMSAARHDEAIAAEIKKRGAEASKKLEDGSLDPVKIMEISLRLSTNMTRMFACQLRDVEDVDAYLVMFPELSSFEQDDPRLMKHDVVRMYIGALPVPVAYAPWQQLIDFRNDSDANGSFLLIKEWMSEVACASFKPVQMEETLEYLLNRFRTNLESHGIDTTTIPLWSYVVTTPELSEPLRGVGPKNGTRGIFWIEHCRIGLLPGESTSAGSVLAFLPQIDLGLREVAEGKST